MPKQVPYEPKCEVCLEIDENLDKEIRLESLKRGGQQMMALYHPLRPLSMCDTCRGILIAVLRDIINPDITVEDAAREAVRKVMGQQAAASMPGLRVVSEDAT